MKLRQHETPKAQKETMNQSYARFGTYSWAWILTGRSTDDGSGWQNPEKVNHVEMIWQSHYHAGWITASRRNLNQAGHQPIADEVHGLQGANAEYTRQWIWTRP